MIEDSRGMSDVCARWGDAFDPPWSQKQGRALEHGMVRELSTRTDWRNEIRMCIPALGNDFFPVTKDAVTILSGMQHVAKHLFQDLRDRSIYKIATGRACADRPTDQTKKRREAKQKRKLLSSKP